LTRIYISLAVAEQHYQVRIHERKKSSSAARRPRHHALAAVAFAQTADPKRTAQANADHKEVAALAAGTHGSRPRRRSGSG